MRQTIKIYPSLCYLGKIELLSAPSVKAFFEFESNCIMKIHRRDTIRAQEKVLQFRLQTHANYLFRNYRDE